jgi:UDP-N-acetylglucosamine acyltransferase
MGCSIHRSAVVDAAAELADDVEVGPHAVIGPEVAVGEGCRIDAGAQLRGPLTLGPGNRIYAHACLGFDPQDLKYGGERTCLAVGARNVFREFCTVHRGTGKGGGLTTIGDDNLFMAYAHVAHDCAVGSRTIFSNGGTLAGHVLVEDDAVIGAYSAVHQFCRVGRHAYIGGYSVITQDALPFAKTVGHKPAFYGLNRVGLERKGYGADDVRILDRALRLLVRSGLPTPEAVERLRDELGGHPDVDYLIGFVTGSQRGIVKTLPGRRGSRGGGGE